jgi:outer membrane lipoprotein LolB
VLAGAVWAVGCARLPVVSDGLSFDEREARLAATDSWEMRGRLAVDTGERAFQARFRWRQAGDDLRLTVRGPLGSGSFEVSGSPDAMTVLTRGETRVLTDPEHELSVLFGWWLPVTSLPHWLIGLPDDGYAARTDFAVGGTLAGLEQRQWRIDYAEYQLTGGILVPHRLTLANEPLHLELTIDTWQPAEPDTEQTAASSLN